MTDTISTDSIQRQDREPRSFKQIVKRLFAPVSEAKRCYAKGMMLEIAQQLFDISTILLLKYIADYVQYQQADQLLRAIYIYIGALVTYLIADILMRHRGWARNEPTLLGIIYARVMQRFFRLDQTAVEKIGTGRIINYIESGAEQRKSTLVELNYVIVGLTIKSIFAFYIVFSLGVQYGIGFIVLFVLGQVVSIGLNKYTLPHRAERKDHTVQITRSLVRTIMSRREVLFSNNATAESKKITTQTDHICQINYRINNYLYAMFNTPRVIVQLLVITI